MLRAIGVGGGALARSLLVQVVVVVLGGVVVGAATHDGRALPRATAVSGRRLAAGGVVRTGLLVLVLACVASLGAVRRVLRIDPARALTPGGARVIIALRELRRNPRRFVTATIVLTLLVVLLLFLGGLLDGLYLGSTGALRAQRADVIVYSADANDSIIRSRIDAETRAEVEKTPGVTEVGGSRSDPRRHDGSRPRRRSSTPR